MIEVPFSPSQQTIPEESHRISQMMPALKIGLVNIAAIGLTESARGGLSACVPKRGREFGAEISRFGA